jgi:uncharacterized membrane protein YdjX (TVP38/TMEM64 family)
MDQSWNASTRLLGALGMVLGAAVAVLVPFVVLKYGEGVSMGSFAATILSLCGITGGAIIAVATAFFALVIPKRNGE